MQIVLASRSPRRVELLQRLFDEYGVVRNFVIEPADIDETPRPGESPRAMVVRLAEEKADVIARRHDHDCLVIGSDTTVEVDGESLGQPDDEAMAAAMLRRLSGRTHWVHTGVSVVRGSARASRLASAQVTMVPFTDELLRWYLTTGEYRGKAGAYAVQGEGAHLVERVAGALTTVIGLPLETVADLMAEVAPGWNLPG